MSTCCDCLHWNYDNHTARVYGEGGGYCEEVGEVRADGHQACLLFEERQNNSTDNGDNSDNY